MYWRKIAGHAFSRTTWLSADKGLSIVYAILRALTDKWPMTWNTFISLTPHMIVSALIAYLVLCFAQFSWNYFRAVGEDQDSKQQGIEDAIRQLAKLLNPELPKKAQQAIEKLEGAILEADTVFSRPPITPDMLSAWTVQTEYALAHLVGQSSDWFEKFESGVREIPHPIEIHQNSEQVLLLRRVSVLRDLINEIKHQRVLVLAR